MVGGSTWTDGSSPTAVTAGNAARFLTDREGRLAVTNDHPRRVRCALDASTATVLTEVTGCGVLGAGLSYYITDISFGSSAAGGVAANASPTLRYGTGANCATGPATWWSAATAANGSYVSNLSTPIKIPATNAVCMIMSTAGTKWVVLSGFIAPG